MLNALPKAVNIFRAFEWIVLDASMSNNGIRNKYYVLSKFSLGVQGIEPRKGAAG